MTQDKAKKKAVRDRMAVTGEQYTVARRKGIEDRETVGYEVPLPDMTSRVADAFKAMQPSYRSPLADAFKAMQSSYRSPLADVLKAMQPSNQTKYPGTTSHSPGRSDG